MKETILYIGDSPELISALSAVPDTRITFIHVSDAIAAGKYLKSCPTPLTILCDLKFPGGNGFDMHTELRGKPTFNHSPFILVCDEFRAEDYKRAFNKRIDDYFVLPITDVEGLLERIDFLLGFRLRKVEGPVYHMPFIKRLFDIVVASLALILLSPLILIVIIAIRLESKGKVYYTSKRMGNSLEAFDFYKLRSMRIGAEAEHDQLTKEKNQYSTGSKRTSIDYDLPCEACDALPDGVRCSTVLFKDGHEICENSYNQQRRDIAITFSKISNDPRITKVGKFIRNTSIDELPQLLNVIKGDMSIVGNRPLPPKEAHTLTKDDLAKRILAPAGITGLWQVKLRGQGGVMSEAERKRLDNDYYDYLANRKYSFLFDLKLILLTVRALFQKDTV